MNTLFGVLAFYFFILGFIGVGTMYAFYHDDSSRWFQQLGYTAYSLILAIANASLYRNSRLGKAVSKWYNIATSRSEYSNVEMANVEDLTEI